MSTQHWVLVGGFCLATGSVIQGLDHFTDLQNPAIIGGLVIQLGTQIMAVFTEPPKRKK